MERLACRDNTGGLHQRQCIFIFFSASEIHNFDYCPYVFGKMIAEIGPKHARECHHLTTWRMISEIYISAFPKLMLAGPDHLVVLCLMIQMTQKLKMTLLYNLS